MSIEHRNRILTIKTQLLNSFWNSSDIQGCTKNEINHIIEGQGVSSLPNLYEEFMLLMGRQCIFFERQYYAYPYVPNFKLEARDFLAFWRKIKPLTFELPDNAFVFFSSDGASYWYFNTNPCNDDPPIYCFWEDDEVKHRQLFDNLSIYLEAASTAVINRNRRFHQNHPPLG